MGIISWILLGAIVGLLAGAALPGKFPGGIPGTVLGGIAGAFLGGAIFSLIAGRAVTGFDPLSLLIALAGAAALLVLVRAAGQADGEVGRKA
jgi:uncharacterized membrane protein YeaQ/YmgE (transglycosylase-associated protein family)